MRTWNSIAVLVALSGCGIAAGKFNGKPKTDATTSPDAPPTKSFGSGVCGKCGFAAGALPGVGHLSIVYSNTNIENTGPFVRLFVESIYRLASGNGLALEVGFAGTQFDRPEIVMTGPDDTDPMRYLAADAVFKYVYAPNTRVQFSIGGGGHLGSVGGESALGARAVLGLQSRLFAMGGTSVLLRFDGNVARGSNEFTQSSLYGGFVLAF
jgi:hypothetical protein